MKSKNSKIKVKKIFFLLMSFCFFLWIFYRSILFFDQQEEKKIVENHQKITRISLDEQDKLQEGDIILRRGYGFFSDLIAKKFQNDLYELTHAGIICKNENQWAVIHSLSSEVSDFSGVQIQKLSDFLRHSTPKKILIVRLKNSTPEQRKSICQKAFFYLEQGTEFDHFGEIDSPEKMFCTELIWQIIGTDLQLISLPTEKTERQKIFYSIAPLYNPQYFEIIINTFENKN